MTATPLVTRTKNYIVVKIPRLWAEVNFSQRSRPQKSRQKMTEEGLLNIVAKGESEYKEGKTKVAGSIMNLLGS